MSLPDLTPEQAAEADRLFQHLRPVVEAELRQLTRLLASKADDKLLGGWHWWPHQCSAPQMSPRVAGQPALSDRVRRAYRAARPGDVGLG